MNDPITNRPRESRKMSRFPRVRQSYMNDIHSLHFTHQPHIAYHYDIIIAHSPLPTTPNPNTPRTQPVNLA
jgi:hypothetical protein